MFLDKDFVLKNDLAKTIYHDYVENMPIIDYHCHLDPKEIYENKKFNNITEAWLGGDHYKWRLMRANGVPEKLITGDGDDYEKFLAWADTIDGSIGNPLYVWTNLELRRIFGIKERLNKENAPVIWEKANKRLQEEDMSVRELIKKFNVKVIGTTDDPADDLAYHQKLTEEPAFNVFPTFRPDKVVAIELDTFAGYIKNLAEITNIDIKNYADMIRSLRDRIAYFDDLGCRLSDHSFATITPAENLTAEELNGLFQKGLSNVPLTNKDIARYHYGLLLDLMRLYAEKNWTAQLHLMATRNNNSNLMQTYGPDCGADAMGDDRIEHGISRLFDTLSLEGMLPKTILYSLNPKDYIPLTALMACFQEEIKGKIQLGAAWWFNDTISGMRYQMTTLAEGGILKNFVGMLTDSRSFLSYPRHEYFRRILCQLVSEWTENGQLPAEPEYLGPIMADIAYNNAASYFGFTIPDK